MKNTKKINKVTFRVEQNLKYNDFRVIKYVNGIWHNERDNNWNKSKANKKAKEYRQLYKNGLATMSDNI